MRLLLDTCTFLWMALDDQQLSHAARRAVASAGPDVYLSVISACEIAIRLSVPVILGPSVPEILGQG